MFSKIFSLPISRLLVLSMVVVSFIPLLVLASVLYEAAWQNAWREINEKHRLLAMNLAGPVQNLLSDKQRMLGLVSNNLADIAEHGFSNRQIAGVLRNAKTQLNEFDVVTVVDHNGHTRALISSYREDKLPSDVSLLFADSDVFLEVNKHQKAILSGVRRSRVSDRPTVLIGMPIFFNDRMIGVILGELSLNAIEAWRRNIHFGKNGHSAIVDQTGKAIAHPNPNWVQEIRDLSGLDIVKKMMAGETGVTEFYSPFVKENMVAGYTSVENYGWGIMVPQPKSEVEEQVMSILLYQLGWGGIGLAFAILAALVMVKRITSPINELAESAKNLIGNEYTGELPIIHSNAPREITELSFAIIDLVSGLQNSRDEYHDLNLNLKQRIVEATAEVQASNRRLQKVAKKAEQASSEKSHFLSSMSHELRTPLNAVIGYVEMVREELREAGYPQVIADLRRVESSARHLLSLVNDVLDLSKIEAGKMEAVLGSWVLKDLIKEVEYTAEPLMQSNNNLLHILYENDPGLFVTDAMKLKQIVLNLLSNAAKFTQDGQVSLEVARRGSGSDDVISLIVRDTGIGMSHEQIAHLFKPFSQVNSGFNQQYGGTGLGLTICRHFCHILGGEIEVESVPGKGTVFSVSLPANLELPETHNNSETETSKESVSIEDNIKASDINPHVIDFDLGDDLDPS